MNNTLAVKALNQYRKRDIFPYLGLRYYLSAKASANDRWIREICTRLLVDTKVSGYLRTYHFKCFGEEGVEHRDIYLPSPNEILAEVALITEISKYESFKPRSYVYSYRYTDWREKEGVFQAYFNGFKERHRHIAEACRNAKDGVVFYTDIKKFYPSIRSSDAISVWQKACEQSDIGDEYRIIGQEILKRHNAICVEDGSGKGLLTGPVFSHVIANLLLGEVDVLMHEATGGNYWRYVDDVVFVGGCDEVAEWRKILVDKLDELGLVLHDGDKDFQVGCDEWLKGEHDFNDSFGVSWVSLIADVKRFVLANPYKVDELRDAFRDAHIRIPVLDYSSVANESTYLERFQDWMRKYKWAKGSVRRITIEGLVAQAINCEREFGIELDKLLAGAFDLSIFERKRIVPKMRYLSGRLLYLASRDRLHDFSARLSIFSELELIAETMSAIATRNISKIVTMGSNAAHIASQLMVVEGSEVFVDAELVDSAALRQSLAVVELNGLSHNYISDRDDLRKLALAEGIKELMSSENVFIREFACLHGVSLSRHQEMLSSSFDRDEELALDVLNQLQSSSHC